MKKLTIVSVLMILAIAIAGCSGATDDYALSTIPIEDAPQEVVDQLESVELERGHMLLDPGTYDVDSTHVVLIGEEELNVSEHMVENGILRMTINNDENDENATQENGYNVLVVETDLDLNIATIADEDEIGYPGLLGE